MISFFLSSPTHSPLPQSSPEPIHRSTSVPTWITSPPCNVYCLLFFSTHEFATRLLSLAFHIRKQFQTIIDYPEIVLLWNNSNPRALHRMWDSRFARTNATAMLLRSRGCQRMSLTFRKSWREIIPLLRFDRVDWFRCFH